MDYKSLLERAVLDEREACAKMCEPEGERPCDCDRCDCGNSGDLEAVTLWDVATSLARRIRERTNTDS